LPPIVQSQHKKGQALMRYPPDLLDEIRSRLPVSRVVERRVKLKRAGREYMGLSPFKTERTASFTVNDQKGFYHCFASGEHGDIFTFVMKTEGLSFPEAIERLASEAGVPLPALQSVDEAEAGHEARVRDTLEEACRFFESALAGREGNAARAYLERRGVSPSELKTFRLGYAPDSKSSLKTHLSGKGFTLEHMQDAGLLIHGDDIALPYDRFRGRLIFPITDAKRRVIAFGGRALMPDQQPKYLNSPETALFHKGHVLFNFPSAREASRTAKAVIVAEGYMDVIALSRAGFENAVAPLGTALTSDQLRLLWTMSPMPTLCFDGDAAGQKAAHRALDGALPFLEPGRSLQFAFLPEGRDPDDMVSGGASEELSRILGQPAPLIDVLWSREEARHPLQTPEQRASFEARLMELAGQIEHKSLKYHYISAFRDRLRGLGRVRAALRPGTEPSWRARSLSSEGKGRERHAASSSRAFPGRPAAPGVIVRTSSLLSSKIVQPSSATSALREALLIIALLRHPWLLDEFMEDIASVHLDDADCSRLRDEMLTVHQTEESLDNKKLLEHLCRVGFHAELERIERATAHKADGHFVPGASKEQVLEGWRHVMMLHGKVGIPRSLREAESDYLSDPTSENFSKLRAIVQQVEIVAS
jgi:DNA primase